MRMKTHRSLLDDMERREFMRKVRSALLSRIRSGGSRGYAPVGPTAGRFRVISQTLPTAKEEAAFNERIKNRALYGRYGRGGLLREQLEQKQKEDLAKKARQRWEDILKEREQLRKEAETRWKMSGGEMGLGPGGALGQAPQVRQGSGPAISIGPGSQLPTTTQPSVSAVPSMGGGSITIPPGKQGKFIAPPGTYTVPGEYDPSGSFLPSKQQSPGIAEIMKGARKASGTKSSVEKAITKKKKKSREALHSISPASETVKDMFYRAPVHAIGKENIAAAGNTLADMFYRAPWKETKKGMEWLSNYILGGIR